jgi:DsbC/DsbD-like thiol-disulfide interchange protein
MLRLALIASVTLVAAPALGAATPWQDIAPGARARLISSDAENSGVTLAGLELDLPQTSNTYWRIPGEGGIPTQIDLGASQGVNDATIAWPYPAIETQNGLREYVYRGPVVLPVTLKAVEGAVLDASVTLGVCSDICVPVKVHFTLALSFAKPDSAQSIRLTQALADAPATWSNAARPFGAITAGVDDRSIILAAPNPAIVSESLIAETDDPAILLGAPQKSPDGALWTLQVLGGTARGLVGHPIQLTFETAARPFTASILLTPAAN